MANAVLPPDEKFAADEEWSQFLEEDQQSQLVDAPASKCSRNESNSGHLLQVSLTNFGSIATEVP